MKRRQEMNHSRNQRSRKLPKTRIWIFVFLKSATCQRHTQSRWRSTILPQVFGSEDYSVGSWYIGFKYSLIKIDFEFINGTKHSLIGNSLITELRRTNTPKSRAIRLKGGGNPYSTNWNVNTVYIYCVYCICMYCVYMVSQLYIQLTYLEPSSEFQKHTENLSPPVYLASN